MNATWARTGGITRPWSFASRRKPSFREDWRPNWKLRGRGRYRRASGTSYRRLGGPHERSKPMEPVKRSRGAEQRVGRRRRWGLRLCKHRYVYLPTRRNIEQAGVRQTGVLAMERSRGNLAGELSNCCNLRSQALASAGFYCRRRSISWQATTFGAELSKSGLFSFLLELSHGARSTAYMKVGRIADAEVLLNMGIERARRDGTCASCGAIPLHSFAIAPDRPAIVKDGSTRAKECWLQPAAHSPGGGHPWKFQGIWTLPRESTREFCSLCREEGRWDEAFEHLEAAP